MRRVICANPSLEGTYKTYLSSQYTNGLILNMVSNVSFQPLDIIVVGEKGDEATESKEIISLQGKLAATLNAALNFSHPKDTPVYKTAWDTAIIEGKANPGDGWTVLSQSPIQWDRDYTVFFHPQGTQNWQYRFKYWNAVTNVYSDYSPTGSGAGFARNQVGYMIIQVRRKTKDFDARVVDDVDIIGFFNDAQNFAQARNPRYFFLAVDTKQSGVPLTVTAGTDVYSLDQYANFGHLDNLRLFYTSGSVKEFYRLTYKPNVEFDYLRRNQNLGQNDFTRYYTFLPPDANSSNGYVQIAPVPQTTGPALLYPKYYKLIPDLETVEDKTIVPLPQLLENFAIAAIERVRGNDAKAALYDELFWGATTIGNRRYSYTVASKLEGLALLDELDRARKNPQGQARVVKKFMGQKGAQQTAGYPFENNDDVREKFW